MKSLAHLNKYFLKYKYHLLLGFVFIVVHNIFAIYPAQLVREALDTLTETIAGKSPDAFAKTRSVAMYFGGLILLMAVLKGVFMFFMRQTIIVMSRRIEYDLKNEIYAHYQLLDLAFYRRNNTGDLVARISEDVSRVRMYLGPAVMYSANLVVTFIFVIYKMLMVNSELTLYVLSPLPILAFSIYYVSTLINRRSERVQARLSKLSVFVQESFSGIRVLKAYAGESRSQDRFATESKEYMGESMRLVKVNGFFAPLMVMLVGISTSITIYVGGMQVINNEIRIGNIAEFIMYTYMLTWPVTALGWVSSLVQRAAASQERINQFLNIQPDIQSPDVPKTPIKGHIVFDKVSFNYPDTGIHALKNVSFSIAPGETLALLGPTGCGKSTVANLITRLYDPTQGSIQIDGVEASKHNLEGLRTAIGYVPQDVFLFSDTIFNNIAFGVTGDPSDWTEKVVKAAKDAAVNDNIDEFPDKYQTEIGERGITLSGGQKQRISIARAILKEPPILIFDDCLSAVDNDTMEHIMGNLKRLSQNRTTIIISHNVSLVKHADKILMLDDGQIVEKGTHFELLSQKGAYFELFERQRIGELKTD